MNKTCSNCGHKNTENPIKCTKCGLRFNAKSSASAGSSSSLGPKLFIIVGLLACALVVGYYVASRGPAPSTASAANANSNTNANANQYYVDFEKLDRQKAEQARKDQLHEQRLYKESQGIYGEDDKEGWEYDANTGRNYYRPGKLPR